MGAAEHGQGLVHGLCVSLVSWNPSSFALGVVQVRACRRKATRGVDTQGRRGRDTGSYVDRGERREVRAWAARSVKRLGFHGTSVVEPNRSSLDVHHRPGISTPDSHRFLVIMSERISCAS
jgi:hypothetical protein